MIDNKYEVLDSLGQGGFGEVFKVRDIENGNEFALKVCTEKDEEYLRRFAREVRLMESIDDDSVVSILDFNLENEPPYFLMPLAEGSLKTKITSLKDNHKLALDVFLKVCKGIQVLHASKIIHRDIKPDNIFLKKEGNNNILYN